MTPAAVVLLGWVQLTCRNHHECSCKGVRRKKGKVLEEVVEAFQEDLCQKGFKRPVRWVAASVLKNTERRPVAKKRAFRRSANDLACTERQMELRMVQSIHNAVQVHPTHMCGPGLLRSPGFYRRSFTSCPGCAVNAIFIFVALDRPFWKGQCRKAELLHVELWVQGPGCSYTFSSVALLLLWPLVNLLEKNLKLIKRVIFVALAKWEMEFLPICTNRGLAAVGAQCWKIKGKRSEMGFRRDTFV